jgi:hypothetical protein
MLTVFGMTHMMNHLLSMDCKTCEELLAAYKRSIGFFTKAVQRIPARFGDDSREAAELVNRLRQGFKDGREDLMAHFRQDHSPIDKEAGDS